MKKCVKCNRKYDDSVLVCEDCGLYLIADVVSDLADIDKSINLQNNSNIQNNSTVRRRNRVVPIDDTIIQRDSVQHIDTSQRVGSFEPSEETANTHDMNDDISRESRGIRRNLGVRHRIRRLIRRYYPITRIIIPVVFFVIAVIWIALNWAIVRDFLQCCIISGLIGGALLTFFSVRYGHHFNIDVVTAGIIGGMIIGCILNYNLLGTTTELSNLFMGLGPCLIIIFGIYLAIRGIFR